MEEEVATMVQTVLHVLLECFVNLSERIEKHANTVGYCVSVIMAMFELMAPKHYHLLRNGLASGQIPNIDLEVGSWSGREDKGALFSVCSVGVHFVHLQCLL